VLLIAFLGATILPVSTEEAGGTANQLDESQQSQLAVDANSGVELLTNRKNPVTNLADVTNEDVVSPQKAETVLVVKSAANTCDTTDTKECVPQIGLTYADSTPCPIETVTAPKGSPNVVFLVLDDIGYGGLDASADLSTLQK
jgi:arylsulfatase